MSKTPYELRFEIFKQAYNMVSDKYYSENEKRLALIEKESDCQIPEPKFPTLSDVLHEAEIINDFVSGKNWFGELNYFLDV